CHRDRVPKTFAVAKISRLEVAEEAWLAPPKGFDLKKYTDRNAFQLETEMGVKKVEIRVSAEESWRLKERAPWAVTHDYPDGAVRAEFEISSSKRFFRMVLGYGSFAEILGPPELRAEFSAFLKACL
ncbi:MAG: helix-turn-helix transcriptional regulator, partial [bacterium]